MGIKSSSQKEILKSTADLNAEDRARINTLHDAVREGNLDRFKLLLSGEEDVNVTDQDGMIPLHLAAQSGWTAILNQLLEFESTIDIKDNQMRTSLFLAVANGKLDCVDALLNAGASINTQDKYGWAPLHLAAENGNVSIAKKLLDRKAWVNISDNRKLTPLHVTLPDCVDVLLDYGADITAQCFTNRTPLHFAVEQGYDDVIKKLLRISHQLDHNPDYVDMKDGKGFTALHIACMHLKLNLVLQLLDAGAKWDLVDYCDRTMMWHLINSLSKTHPHDVEIPLLMRILKRTNDKTEVSHGCKTAIRWAIECWIGYGLDFEYLRLFIATQKKVNMKDTFDMTLLNFFTGHYKGNKALEVVHLCINHGNYLIPRDCKSIKKKPALQNILQDVELCTKSIINQFNHSTLKRFYEYLQDIKWVVPIEALRIHPGCGIWRIIEEDVKSEIGRNGYCDVSCVVTTSLSKRCIESYCNWALACKSK